MSNTVVFSLSNILENIGVANHVLSRFEMLITLTLAYALAIETPKAIPLFASSIHTKLFNFYVPKIV